MVMMSFGWQCLFLQVSSAEFARTFFRPTRSLETHSACRSDYLVIIAARQPLFGIPGWIRRHVLYRFSLGHPPRLPGGFGVFAAESEQLQRGYPLFSLRNDTAP